MQARSTGEPELLQAQRRRRDAREGERAAPRRARRRRQSTPWLQRNALSVAAVAVLVAFLSVGFALLQMLNRGDPGSPLTLAQADLAVPTSSTNVLSAAAASGGVSIVPAPPADGATPADAGQRTIHTSVKVLQPDYTIAPGDTLVKIAERYNTSVERIQAFNNLSDPRSLRIGVKLIIPPPL